MAVMMKMACAGAGLTVGMAETFAPYRKTCELRIVLERFCPPLPGFFPFLPRVCQAYVEAALHRKPVNSLALLELAYVSNSLTYASRRLLPTD